MTMNLADTWRGRAACRGEPGYFFFNIADRYGIDRQDPVLLAEGRKVCNRCHVREECLNDALEAGPDLYGLWGGTTKAEREALRRMIRRAACPVCGSSNLHGARTWQACFDCGQSWTTMRPAAQARAENADTAA